MSGLRDQLRLSRQGGQSDQVNEPAGLCQRHVVILNHGYLMNIQRRGADLFLRPGQVAEVTDEVDCEIRCVNGRAWVNRQGDPAGVALGMGEFTIARPGATIISSPRPAHLVIPQAASSRVPSAASESTSRFSILTSVGWLRDRRGVAHLWWVNGRAETSRESA